MADAGGGQRLDRLAQSRLAEVEGMVVRQADDREAGVAEPRRGVDAIAAALASGTPRDPAVGKRALEVAEDDVAREVGLDVGEEAATVVGREIAAPNAMSPVAVIEIGTGVGGCSGTCSGRGRGAGWATVRRRRAGRRLLGAVDEQRDHDGAQGDDCACTHDQRDDPHGLARSVPVAEEDQRVVRELRERSQRGGDAVIAAAVSTLRAPCASPRETRPMSFSWAIARREASNSTGR